MSLRAAIELFLTEERQVPAALRQQARAIEQACRLVARALKSGGRLFYVGAGTSGRLGVLDASECPPTFCSPPGQVQVRSGLRLDELDRLDQPLFPSD